MASNWCCQSPFLASIHIFRALLWPAILGHRRCVSALRCMRPGILASCSTRRGASPLSPRPCAPIPFLSRASSRQKMSSSSLPRHAGELVRLCRHGIPYSPPPRAFPRHSLPPCPLHAVHRAYGKRHCRFPQLRVHQSTIAPWSSMASTAQHVSIPSHPRFIVLVAYRILGEDVTPRFGL
jgi:hypothetical protein